MLDDSINDCRLCQVPKQAYNGYCKATEDGNQRTPGKKSGERNVESRFYLGLEEDLGGSTRQNWMETNGLCRMLHWE